jgi:hypothetical protein
VLLAIAAFVGFVLYETAPEATRTPAGAEKQESPAISGDAIVAEANAKLASFDCGRLAPSMRGSTLTVTGNVAAENDLKRMRSELTGIGGVRDVNISQVQVVPRPYCETVAMLAPYITTGPGGPAIALQGGAATAREGDKLLVEVTGAEFGAALYAELFDTEGNVVHLLPNAKEKKNRLEPGQRISLGDDPIFGMQWDVVAPFGKHMLLVIASRTPLFQERRKDTEQVSAYHRALRQNLEGKAVEDVRAAYAVIDFVPRR